MGSTSRVDAMCNRHGESKKKETRERKCNENEGLAAKSLREVNGRNQPLVVFKRRKGKKEA